MRVGLQELNSLLAPFFEDREEINWDEVHLAILPLCMGRNRLGWDEYFMTIADVIGMRATCDRGRSGAIIVKDHKILTTGYVGSPPNMPHCDEVGHLMYGIRDDQGKKSKHCLRTLHAEENAIIQAAEFGIPIKGATLYCRMTPCFHRCAMKIARVGIKRIVARKRYHADGRSVEVFKEAGIQLDILNDEIEKYKSQ